MLDGTDEAFVDEVVLALSKRVDEKRFGPICRSGGLRNLTEAERIVLYACWAMGIIQNGGFQFFYEGATNMAEVANAYECLGYLEAAEACRKSLSIFPNGIPPEDADERLSILSSYQGFRDEFFRSLNEAVWEAGDANFEATIANYIRIYMLEFKDGMPKR